MFKFIAPVAAGIAILTAPTTAFASEARNVVTVSLSDLDLTTEEGVATMQKRVRAAALKACMFDEKGQIVAPEAQNNCARVAHKQSQTQMAQKIANVRYGG